MKIKYLQPTSENIAKCVNGDAKLSQDVHLPDGHTNAARLYIPDKGQYAGKICCEYPWLLAGFFGIPKKKTK